MTLPDNTNLPFNPMFYIQILENELQCGFCIFGRCGGVDFSFSLMFLCLDLRYSYKRIIILFLRMTLLNYLLYRFCNLKMYSIVCNFRKQLHSQQASNCRKNAHSLLFSIAEWAEIYKFQKSRTSLYGSRNRVTGPRVPEDEGLGPSLQTYLQTNKLEHSYNIYLHLYRVSYCVRGITGSGIVLPVPGYSAEHRYFSLSRLNFRRYLTRVVTRTL